MEIFPKLQASFIKWEHKYTNQSLNQISARKFRAISLKSIFLKFDIQVRHINKPAGFNPSLQTSQTEGMSILVFILSIVLV